ncbi:hypothetical protein M378DRAFT_129177 [Amanita muscaria Koide BX008]|uniref:Rgp1-domain-containing protein n=1 Tax=Amanita muscaria (strain Koide BX008) TaxID=946122 RepID=A0A0C2X0K9_AMAMK|nr:hypothetical protein M378DRAFT_129177 [Amanita muscaria Koide BX008]
MSSWNVVVPESGGVLSARASWWNRGPGRDQPENYPGIQSRRELILYAYAQLSGWMVLLPQLTPHFSLPHAMKNLRAKLAKKTVVGGGSMDLTPSLARGKGHRPPRLRMKAGHGRSTSLAAGLISALMPPTPPGPPQSSPRYLLPPQASQRTVRSVSVNGDVKAGTDEADEDEDIDPEVPLPMFESQPSMLAVDLSLAPGESKTYTYSMTLPSVLPPTFKGRCIKFSYEFSVGVCRAGAGVGFGAAENGSAMASPPPSLASGNGVSRVMKVPIRVYNHVTVGRVPRPYDLLWPVGRRIWEKYQGTVADGIQITAAAERKGGGKQESVDELREYARKILAGRIKKADDGDYDEAESDEDVRIGCREAVEIVTRNPRKVSYDVSKDGVKVAVLTFTKSAYRLGETVLGVVEFNERRGRSRVLQMSAMLEAHEKLPSSLSPFSLEAMTRVHAEQHQSLVMSVLRTTFSLDIPSDAAPAFQVGVGDETRDGGLEWRVRLSLLVAIAKEDVSAGTEGVGIKGMVRDGPRGEWGSSWRASESVAPLQKMDHQEARIKDSSSGRGWAWYLASTILGVPSTEEETLSDSDEYDGIKADLGGGVGRGVRYGGGESGWKAMATEVVECTVPVSVWAGNTAFKAVNI